MLAGCFVLLEGWEVELIPGGTRAEKVEPVELEGVLEKVIIGKESEELLDVVESETKEFVVVIVNAGEEFVLVGVVIRVPWI